MLYMTLSSQEKYPFLLGSYFQAHPTTLLLKILGRTNAWAVPPPQILGGTVPPVPLGLRPWRRPRISIVIATFCPLLYCCCPLIFLAKLCKWLGNISQYLICADRYHVAYMYGCQMALSKIMDNGSAGVSGIKY